LEDGVRGSKESIASKVSEALVARRSPCCRGGPRRGKEAITRSSRNKKTVPSWRRFSSFKDQGSLRRYFFFLAAFFFLATFFLAAFFLVAFFLVAFLAVFFLATFFFATFFLAAFFFAAFFFAIALKVLVKQSYNCGLKLIHTFLNTKICILVRPLLYHRNVHHLRYQPHTSHVCFCLSM